MFERIGPNDLPRFIREYRLVGGRIRRIRVLYSGKETAIEFYLSVREAMKTLGKDPRSVRLVLRIEGVSEYRFQMRPNQPRAQIADARIGYLNDQFYVNLDAWTLEHGEQAKLHDYRASEVYAGGRELLARIIKPEEPKAGE
jgi:hypothetical protein